MSCSVYILDMKMKRKIKIQDCEYEKELQLLAGLIEQNHFFHSGEREEDYYSVR